MKKEYTEKMNSYQDDEYEKFLKDKCVLDAKQYLHSSMLYLHYAITTAKLYEDIGKMDITEPQKNMNRMSIELLGWHYNEHHILNKCALEWIAHISNSLDCLLQYINAALNLKIPVKSVSSGSVSKKLQTYGNVLACCNLLWKDDIVEYIQTVYNFSKHTLDLYGNSSLLDVFNGQRDIQIPAFRYRNKIYDSRQVSDLIAYYETFLGLYIAVLDSVKDELVRSCPVQNRFHIGELVIDGHRFKKSLDSNDLVLMAEFADDGEHIKRYWMEEIPFLPLADIEIMQIHNKTIGQHFGWISKIELFQDSQQIGVLEIENTNFDTSVLAYHKYKFIPL